MSPRDNERPPMAHPQEPKPETVDTRLPMVSKKPGLSRRIQIGLAKLGLITTVAAGGAGVVHHVTGVDVTGPVGLGAAADNLGSAVADNFVRSSYSEPKHAQEDLGRETEATKELLKPNYARVGGQIEIDLANLSEAQTQDILFAIRLGKDYEKIDPSRIKAVDKLSAEPGAIFVVDNPTVVDLTEQGLGVYYTGTIENGKGIEPVLIPENSVKLTVPGELKPLSAVENSDILDVARKISPTQ